MTSAPRKLRVVAALAGLFLVSACGRKGPLEGPPGSNLPPARAENAAPASVGTPENVGHNPAADGAVPPKTRFFLDPLL